MQSIKTLFFSCLSKTLLLLAPSLERKLTESLLCKPIRRKSQWTKQVTQFEIRTRFGQVKAYKYGGSGKTVWLVHGWSESSYQFWPLMQSLAEEGYEVIAFDLPAHGNSKGKYCNLPKMIKAFEDISKALLKPHMVVTHRLGASVVTNSKWMNQYQSRLLLISPIMNYYDILVEKAQRIGLNLELIDNFVQLCYRKYHLLLPELDASRQLKSFKGEIKVVHDRLRESKDIPAEYESLMSTNGSELITTNNFGQHKMLKSKTLVNLVTSSAHAQLNI